MPIYLKTFTLEYGVANNTRLRTFRASVLKPINDNSLLQLIKPWNNFKINNTGVLVCRCARVGIPKF